MIDDAKFHLQSKLGTYAPVSLTLPKFFSRTLHHLSTCLGFLSWLPT